MGDRGTKRVLLKMLFLFENVFVLYSSSYFKVNVIQCATQQTPFFRIESPLAFLECNVHFT